MALTDEEMDICRGIGERAEKIYAETAHMGNREFGTLMSTLLSVWLDHHVAEKAWPMFLQNVTDIALSGAMTIQEKRNKLQ